MFHVFLDVSVRQWNFTKFTACSCLTAEVHEFPGFIHHYSKILDTPLSNLEMRAGGLNHFGVLLSIKYIDKNKDAYPDLRKKAPQYLSNLRGFMNDVDLVKYILEKFGYIPYTQDSHYGEYISWGWEKANVEGARAFYNGYKNLTLFKEKSLYPLYFHHLTLE